MIGLSALLIAAAQLQFASAATGDLCYIVGANSAIVGNRLYLMGGNYSIQMQIGTELQKSSSLFVVDINEDLPVNGALPQTSYSVQAIDGSAQIAYSNAEIGVQDSAYGSHGALWSTNDTIYVFGGTTYNSSLASDISAYDIARDSWADVSVIGGAFNFGHRDDAQYVSVPDAGLSYIAGGASPAMYGLVQFNATDSGALSWSNITTSDAPNLNAGNLIYIPAGEQGLLVSFGGRNLTDGINRDSGLPFDSDWSIIYIYDIASQTWWKQKASGDVPKKITGTCAVVAASADGSSFQITVYGGWSHLDLRNYEWVFTLSLPSFTWVNVTDISSATNAHLKVSKDLGTQVPTCQAYNNSYMLVIGGLTSSGTDVINYTECNDNFAPIRALDLSTYQWQTSLKAVGTYQAPSITQNTIGGNSSGHATKTRPELGWTNSAIEEAMQKRVAQRNISVPPTSGSAASQSGVRGSTPVQSIVGGVVGAVIGLAVLATAMLWLRRRVHRKRSASALEAWKLGSAPGDQDMPAKELPATRSAKRCCEVPGQTRPTEMADGSGMGFLHELQDAVHELEQPNRA